MSVVCERCGTANRNSAMFCIGCAGKLPGFNPSAPSALESVRAELALAKAHSRLRGHRHDAQGRELPAESPAFWLRLGGIMLLMCLAFLGWYAYVTRDHTPRMGDEQKAATRTPPASGGSSATDTPSASSVPSNNGASGSAAPVANPAPFRDPEAPIATTAPAAPNPSPTTKAASASPGNASTNAGPSDASTASAPNTTPRPSRATAPTATPERAASSGEGSAGSSPPTGSSAPMSQGDAAAIRAARREARAANARPLERSADDAAAEAARRYIDANRAMPDLGPPVASGPGPLVNRSGSSAAPVQAAPTAPVVAPRSRTPDLGPPVAPGPGPQYDNTRGGNGASIRDNGPPVAAGPGPLYDDGAERSALRGRTLVSGAAGDPFAACANLDYLSMQSCRNSECQRPANASHPRCEALRHDLAQRDEVRRRIARGN